MRPARMTIALALGLILLSTSGPSAAEPGVRSADGRKYLIIHADDAGMCHSVNRTTIDALDYLSYQHILIDMDRDCVRQPLARLRVVRGQVNRRSSLDVPQDFLKCL
jgi:hypothetical protein